ncbi:MULTISPECIES: peptide-methionine (S)-S-oxide reductase MsrA [Pseudomonas]|jgi:peptide-methionine (S)-S-oxide reductase|uniref:Peptide methionine sulfoxide reductase MsrA n=1 Tax=Pseudomonas neustonica TaxID=2487346 RepID=A0ABX9XDM8_9PSED|nr:MULTISPECIES: peptide-methionine (S)-S-oxide reductase MsrA [Pseudomonas]MAB25179.1 peptide-methionine (S)-S-oxide reductase [Pseudomonadales bacterium]MBA6420825.1 peptide-methionine (S)-S-oxide reductase MsrA [Pseudomonas sp. 5Ae-yellow]ROZ80412.1 peptide-methionine (S)-S-oxide reductase [Pseudomonas sp. SSM44]ROZ81231.1 peptide-methionine (S)-S-oxide reductase [Pseudomonas neustonica]|tara:strand:+ start:1973 stop:2578 length:606 start_codon:yes stop_codon:yes gene_type:complete
MKKQLMLGAALLLSPLLQAAEPLTQGPEGTEMAVFAGGCFWCTESDFDKVPGVVETISGYTGGSSETAHYNQVSSGDTGHIESVAVFYDPSKTSYAKLVEAFWPTIDPVTANAQFCDSGPQYRSAIYYADEQQQALLEASRQKLADSGRFDDPIVTEILPRQPFYAAEDYHQDYYHKNPLRYNFYRTTCGRDARLEELWGE